MKLRRYEARDEPALLALWHETKIHAYPYLPTEQSYTLEMDRSFFREHVAPACEIWIAEEAGALLGFLALEGSYVDRLFVHPDAQRRGVGRALLEKAKQLRPDGLELDTHQQNVSACAFYEKHGLRPVRYGTSPPPESAPDLHYVWSP